MEEQRLKKKRTENWTQFDKDLLKSLIADRMSIIENKSCDTNTNRAKKDCWDSILELFNASSQIQRKVVQLQFQWKGMKLKAKRSGSNFRKETNSSSGAPSPKPAAQEYDGVDQVPNESTDDSNKFVSDDPLEILIIKNEDKASELEQDWNRNENNINESNLHSPNISWHSNASRLTSNKRHRKLKLKKNNDEKKATVYELTKLHMINEHEKRMEIMELEKECRLRELQKIDLEISLLKEKLNPG